MAQQSKAPEVKAKVELEVIKEDEIHHILEPGEFGAELELIVSDPNTIDPLTGKPKITERRVLKSKSFTRQFLELLWVQAYQIPEVVSYSIRDTSNVLQLICESGLTFAADAGIGVVTYGIVIGTGVAAPTINDYSIDATKIPHATCNYSAATFGAPASDATTSQFTITRNFANVSGGVVTVNEIALYVKGYLYNVTYYFMTIRDVIAGGLPIPNGQTLTVNYRPQAVI